MELSIASPSPAAQLKSGLLKSGSLKSGLLKSGLLESVVIVAADHPSLIDARDAFAAELRAERRYFGRKASGPKAFPSLIVQLSEIDGMRLAAMHDGRMIGLACVGSDGEAAVAVVEDWRSRGVASILLRAVIGRAQLVGHQRIFIRSSHRSRAVAALGDALGGTLIDHGRGRVEMIFPVDEDARSA